MFVLNRIIPIVTCLLLAYALSCSGQGSSTTIAAADVADSAPPPEFFLLVSDKTDRAYGPFDWADGADVRLGKHAFDVVFTDMTDATSDNDHGIDIADENLAEGSPVADRLVLGRLHSAVPPGFDITRRDSDSLRLISKPYAVVGKLAPGQDIYELRRESSSVRSLNELIQKNRTSMQAEVKAVVPVLKKQLPPLPDIVTSDGVWQVKKIKMAGRDAMLVRSYLAIGENAVVKRRNAVHILVDGEHYTIAGEYVASLREQRVAILADFMKSLRISEAEEEK
jgi:hypothetical protein